jgi:NAD(P)H-dependent FMN reductase
MLHLQIIIASTRQGRKGHLVGQWFEAIARHHEAFDIEVIDLRDVDLPMFDEPKHPRLQEYVHEHTRAWSEIIDRADAYVFVTPEYDNLPPASLINAIQHLVKEWAYKPVGFVSYGGVSGGTRSVQVLKQLLPVLRMMPIPEGVNIPFFAKSIDEESQTFSPGGVQEKAAGIMLDELSKWAKALKPLRA